MLAGAVELAAAKGLPLEEAALVLRLSENRGR